jgi:nucleotide-binding universal stress UspA family protein
VGKTHSFTFEIIMNRILVPTDFSSNASNAVQYAIGFAKKSGSSIVLLNVFDIPYANSYVSYDFLAKEIKEAKKDSERKLELIASDIKAQEIPYEIHSEYSGLLVDAILKTAKQTQCSLIIMGTKGTGNRLENILGTNTASVLERSKLPVMAIHKNCQFNGLNHITVATDYFEDDFQLVKKSIDLLRPFGATISVVHVPYLYEWESEEQMTSFMSRLRKETDWAQMSPQLLPEGDIETQIEKFMVEKSADLLVIFPRHHAIFSRFFGSSLSRRMAYHTQVPVMTYHL